MLKKAANVRTFLKFSMKRLLYSLKTALLSGIAGLFCLHGQSQQVGVNTMIPTPVVTVNVRQELQLGAFTQGNSGGSISITYDGTRTGTGSVVPLSLGSASSPLILEIQGPKGSIVSMIENEATILTGSNGGTMRLKLKSFNPEMPFVIADDPPAKNIIRIGAELTVGNAQQSPPGNYSGSMNISFVVE